MLIPWRVDLPFSPQTFPEEDELCTASGKQSGTPRFLVKKNMERLCGKVKNQQTLSEMATICEIYLVWYTIAKKIYVYVCVCVAFCLKLL